MTALCHPNLIFIALSHKVPTTDGNILQKAVVFSVETINF